MLHPYPYYPPAGTIEVANDRRWSWDGRRWLLNGRPGGKLPPNAPVRGKPGTALAGWTYDWRTGAWDDHKAPALPPPRPHHPPAHQPPPPPPPQAAPPPPPAPAPPPQITIIREPQKEMHMSQPSFAEELKKHWVWPLIGAVVYLAPDFISEPAPPTITQDMPGWYRDQLNQTYAQNLTRYKRWTGLVEKAGVLFLGGGVAGAAVKAQPHQIHQGHSGHSDGHAQHGHAQHGHAEHHDHRRAA